MDGSRIRAGAICMVACAMLAFAGCDLLTTPEARIERAAQQIAAGEHRAAVFELRKVLGDDPEHAQARLLLAEAEFGSGDISAAESDLDRALKAGADPGRAMVLKARLQLAFGRADVLLTQLDAGEVRLEEPQASVFRGRALLAMRKPQEALAAFESARQAQPGLIEARVGIAEARAALGDFSAALADLADVTNDEPTAAAAWLTRGSLQLQLGRPVDADESLGRALEHAKGRLDETLQIQAMAGLIEARLAENQLPRADEVLAEMQRRAPNAPISRLYRARIELARNDLPSAIGGLTSLTNDFPQFIPARFLLGSALLAQGNLYQAERHMAAVVQALPDNLEARKRLAEIRLRMNRPESAIDLLGGSLDGESGDSRAMALLGAAQLSAGVDASAIPRLEETVARQPDNRAARLDLAGLYVSSGNSAKAIEVLHGLAYVRDDARREFLLVRALADAQGEAAARAELDRMVRQFPDDPERMNLAAGFLLAFGDAAAATALLEKALSVRSDDVPTLVNLGRARLGAGELEAAEALLRRALSHDAGNVDARIVLAEVASRRGQADEARRLLEDIRMDDARAVASRLLLARLHLQARETAKASKALADALAAGQNRPDILVAAGDLLQEFGNHEQALGYYRKAADLEPRQAGHWIRMARAQGALDYGPAARESVGRALALEPQNVDAVGLSVMFDVADGRRDAALARVLELRRRLPQDSAAALLEGDLRSTLGQHAEAAAAFAQSARLKPSLAATVRLAQSRQLAGQRDAIAPLRDWLKTRPGDLPARAMMAILLDQSGQVEPAMREYERVLASGEPDAVMSNNLAVLYQKMGDGRAEALARQAYRLAPTNAAIADTLGWILHSKGAREEGIRLLREAAGLAPQEPEIQLHLAEALLDAGQAGEARAILARLVDGGSEFAGRPRAQELLRRAGG